MVNFSWLLGPGVVHELGYGHEVRPVILLRVAPVSQVLFEPLIASFGLSVRSGVVC